MADDEIKELFSERLNYILSERNKTQKDLCEYIGVSSATASDWCNAKKLPRMDKIQSIARWLGVELSDLLEKKNETKYYFDDDAAEMADFLHKNPDYKTMFETVRNVDESDLLVIKAIIDKYKRTD